MGYQLKAGRVGLKPGIYGWLKFLAFLESQGMGLRTIELSTEGGIGGFETRHLALNFLAFRGKPTIVLYPLLNPLAIDRSHNHIHTTQNRHNIR